MPKQQKQKQKQSQVTKVTVKVGDTIKAKRKSRARPASAPAPRQPSSIGITLQGSSVAFPPPPIQQYNELVQQVDALRRQMALSGSLIPRAATNDIYNRVQATNPFANVSTSIPMATIIRPEGVVEEMVEGATTQDPIESHGYGTHKALDQDWIRNIALANKAQSLPATTKIGVVDDPETIPDINDYDRQQEFNYKALERAAARQRLKEQQKDLEQKKAVEKFKEETELNLMMGEDLRSLPLAGEFQIIPKPKGRPKKMKK